MKRDKDDISENVMTPEAKMAKRLAGRRDRDNYAMPRSMVDDKIRDKKEARGAIEQSGKSDLMLMGVGKLRVSEMVSEDPDEESEVDTARAAPSRDRLRL